MHLDTLVNYPCGDLDRYSEKLRYESFLMYHWVIWAMVFPLVEKHATLLLKANPFSNSNFIIELFMILMMEDPYFKLLI